MKVAAQGIDRLSDRDRDSEALGLDPGSRALRQRGRVLRYILIIIYLAIGVFIANSHHYFSHLNSLMAVVSALLAVLAWPLVLLGVSLHLK